MSVKWPWALREQIALQLVDVAGTLLRMSTIDQRFEHKPTFERRRTETQQVDHGRKESGFSDTCDEAMFYEH